MLRDRIGALAAALCAIFATTASAQVQQFTPAEQQQHRLEMFGTADEVRYMPELVARVFADDRRWPLHMTLGAFDHSRIKHPTLPVTVPIVSGPCRIVDYSALPTGEGAAMFWLCRSTQPLPTVVLSFEHHSISQDTIARELILVDQQALGISAPDCHSEMPPIGLTREDWCESTFDQNGKPGAGRFIVVVGSTPNFFFKSQTVCAGQQCDGVRAAFRETLATLSFDGVQNLP